MVGRGEVGPRCAPSLGRLVVAQEPSEHVVDLAKSLGIKSAKDKATATKRFRVSMHTVAGARMALRRMSVPQWSAAFDAYALAAVATEQLPYCLAFAHKQLCLKAVAPRLAYRFQMHCSLRPRRQRFVRI